MTSGKKKDTRKVLRQHNINRLYDKCYFIKYFTILAYVAMAFFEVPTWCLDQKQIKDHRYGDYDIYPNSGLPKINMYLGYILELSCLGVLLFFTYFRRTFKTPSYNSTVREVIQSVLTFIAVLDIILAMAVRRGTYLSKFIRVFLVIIFIRNLRDSIKRICLVVYDSKEIMMLLISYIVFFSWIGTRLFRGTQEGEKYFPTLTEAVWNLLILLTTANFPDIMLPAYHSHKAYGFFFIIYLVIGLFFMVNLILATYYSNYKNRVEGTINSFISHREEHLVKKFKDYDIYNNGYLSIDQCKQLLIDLLKLDHKKDSNYTYLEELTEIFDTDGNGRISGDEFISSFDILDIMQLKKKESKVHKLRNTHERNRIKKILKHPVYECIVCILICLNLSLILVIDWMELY